MGSGAITENITLYLEHHIKETSMKHPSYLQDTPHFLWVLEQINNGPKLSKNSILDTSDILGLYPNIPQNNGIQCVLETLEERVEKTPTSEFVVKLMDLRQN